MDFFQWLSPRRGSWGMGRTGRGDTAFMYLLCGLNTLSYRCVCVCVVIKEFKLQYNI